MRALLAAIRAVVAGFFLPSTYLCLKCIKSETTWSALYGDYRASLR